MPPRSKFGPREAKLAAYAAPFVLLALLLVLLLVNVKHSMLCAQGGESAAEAMLKRQALEKRLLTLEQETLQNNILFEKFIRRLDDQFKITKGVDLTAVKNAAHFGAQSISARLAEESAPPMPSFSELYNDVAALNDGIDASMSSLNDQYEYGGNGGSGDDKYGGGNLGGESGQMEFADDAKDDDPYGERKPRNGGGKAWRDDFGGDGQRDGGEWNPGAKEVETEQLPEAQARPLCNKWKASYGVQPGVSWGSLPGDLQEKWKSYDCDIYVADSWY